MTESYVAEASLLAGGIAVVAGFLTVVGFAGWLLGGYSLHIVRVTTTITVVSASCWLALFVQHHRHRSETT